MMVIAGLWTRVIEPSVRSKTAPKIVCVERTDASEPASCAPNVKPMEIALWDMYAEGMRTSPKSPTSVFQSLTVQPTQMCNVLLRSPVVYPVCAGWA